MTVHERIDDKNISGPGAITLKEIQQQPALWQTTLERVRSAQSKLLPLGNRPVLVTGAGTSAYAAAAIAASSGNIRAIATTHLLSATREEIVQALPPFAEDGVLLSIARSGNSPESVAVVERIGRLFPAVRNLAITCNQEGKLGQIEGVQTLFLDPRTNDRSLVMTSSFSNLTLAGLSLVHFDRLSTSLPRICQTAETLLPELQILAPEVAAPAPLRAVILASNSLLPLASEAALKILEMTAGEVVALPESYLGLRHGPMSFLRDDSLVFCIVSSDPLKRSYEADLIAELAHKKLGRVVAIGSEEFAVGSVAVRVPPIAPDLPDYLRTPFEILFAQLLGYQLSLKFGLNPDQPSPDGVITRVVQSFRIHQDND